MRWLLAALIVLISWFQIPPANALQCGHHGCSDCYGCADDDHGGCGHHRSWMGRGNQGSHATDASLEGKVIEVVYLPGATQETATVEARLPSDTEEILARLGPIGFLHSKELDLREGDTISVSGYWVSSGTDRILVARKVARANRSVELRDEWGDPLW